MKSSLSIVIPNYNGKKLLEKHLPQVIKHSQGVPIYIVDDASTDDSVSFLENKYSQKITLIQNPKNIGFSASVNKGVANAKTDLVLILNSDVSLTANTIPSLIPHFKNPQVFAVGAKEILPNGSHRGRSRGELNRGLLIHSQAEHLRYGQTLWVFAASGMFRTSIWNQLDGLDPLYAPAYWEDIDLSYRAWKSGYICLFEPKATVLHDTEATMNQTLGSRKSAIAFRNQLLFFWKNINTSTYFLSHLFWLPYRLTITSYKSQGAFLLGFLMALIRLPQVISRRRNYPVTDAETLIKAHS